MSDLALILIVAGFLTVTIGGTVFAKRAMRRYLDVGAIADAYVDAEKPFHLTAPAGGALDLMLRFTVERYRSGSSGRASRGLAVLIEARRPAPADAAGGDRQDAGGFQVRQEFLIGSTAKAATDAPATRIAITYAITRHGSIESSTAVLARIPAGGPLEITGRLAHPPGTLFQSASLFVKPA